MEKVVIYENLAKKRPAVILKRQDEDILPQIRGMATGCGMRLMEHDLRQISDIAEATEVLNESVFDMSEGRRLILITGFASVKAEIRAQAIACAWLAWKKRIPMVVLCDYTPCPLPRHSAWFVRTEFDRYGTCWWYDVYASDGAYEELKDVRLRDEDAACGASGCGASPNPS